MAKPMKTLELHSSMMRFLIMQFLNNSLQLAGKFVRIFVRRHHLFREANTLSFEKQIMPKGKYPDKFSRQMEAIMILQTVFATSAFLKLKLGNVIQIFPVLDQSRANVNIWWTIKTLMMPDISVSIAVTPQARSAMNHCFLTICFTEYRLWHLLLHLGSSPRYMFCDSDLWPVHAYHIHPLTPHLLLLILEYK